MIARFGRQISQSVLERAISRHKVLQLAESQDQRVPNSGTKSLSDKVFCDKKEKIPHRYYSVK